MISTALEAVAIGTNVILDFGFWGRDEHSSQRWLATERGAAHVLIYLRVNCETQLQRLGQRGRKAPQETFDISEAEVDAGRRQFQEPDQDELGGSRIPPPPTDWSSWSDWAAARWPSSIT